MVVERCVLFYGVVDVFVRARRIVVLSRDRIVDVGGLVDTRSCSIDHCHVVAVRNRIVVVGIVDVHGRTVDCYRTIVVDHGAVVASALVAVDSNLD